MKTVQSTNCPNINQTATDAKCVLVAAGRGSRLGRKIAKQYQPFLGEPLMIHSLRTLISHPDIKKVALVFPAGDDEYIGEITEKLAAESKGKLLFVEGGDERSKSVLAGVKALQDIESHAILIHDAARPGIDADMINRLLSALKQYDGAAPALPVVDALKRKADDGLILSVSRESLFRIQTPQAFRSELLSDLLEGARQVTDDEFTKAETAGLNLTLIEGTERLAKITYEEDFERLETLLSNQTIRTGIGYDVHAFEDGDFVTLCGVQIPHDKKLKGHSDADVGWHALTDAILGALAEGDIGDHFPPTDPQWKGAPSSIFLKYASELVKRKNGRIINLDLTIICEAPKVKPHREIMRSSTAEILGLEMDQISVKATTTEQLGFEGRREGIAAQAIATIEIRNDTRHGTDSQ